MLQLKRLGTDEILFEKREKGRAKLEKALDGAGLFQLAAKVKDCSKRFFGFLAPACGCGKAVPVTCGVRLCPHCEKKRGNRLFKTVERLFKGMKDPRFITLTVPNSAHIDGDLIDALREMFVKLRHLKRFQGYVDGGFYVIEITNRGKGWHPHIHALVDGRYYPQAQLSEDWQSCGGGLRVDIRPADQKGVMELCWYMVKGSQFFDSPSMVRALYEAIHGKRLAGAFGCCFNQFNEIRREEKEEKKKPDCCRHGNEYEWAGKLSVSDVYLDVESREWRIFKQSLLFLQFKFFKMIERAA